MKAKLFFLIFIFLGIGIGLKNSRAEDKLKLPNVPLTLNSYVVINQGVTFAMPLSDSFSIKVKQLEVGLNRSGGNDSLWARISSNEARLAYRWLIESDDDWLKFFQEPDSLVFVQMGTKTGWNPKGILENNVPFQKAYPKVWELVNELPLSNPFELIGVGFINLDSNSWLQIQKLIGEKDGKIITEFLELCKKVKVREFVGVGIYSQRKMSWKQLTGKLEESGIKILLIGKSSERGIILSSKFLFQKKEGVYKNYYYFVGHRGSYIFLSAATEIQEAQKLLQEALKN